MTHIDLNCERYTIISHSSLCLIILKYTGKFGMNCDRNCHFINRLLGDASAVFRFSKY